MKSAIRFNPYYFSIAIALFFIECFIARYMHDSIIRPYGGDLLVVILLYCMVRSFLKTDVVKTGLAVLLFACCIEILQYFKIADLLGLSHSSVARIIVGTSFEWIDLLAYTAGIGLVILIEKYLAWRKTRN